MYKELPIRLYREIKRSTENKYLLEGWGFSARDSIPITYKNIYAAFQTCYEFLMHNSCKYERNIIKD